MINESNYHIFLDDFVAGLLDEALEMEFVAFLDQHPGILEEETLEESNEHLAPAFQASLKKEIPLNASHIDEYLVASMEGDLSSKQESDLKGFLEKNPQFFRNKELIALTKIEADLSISYDGKSALKKRPVFYLYTRWAASAAAVFILGMMLFRFLGNNGLPTEEIAGNFFPDISPIELPAVTISAIPKHVTQEDAFVAATVNSRIPNPKPSDIQRKHETIPQQVQNQELPDYTMEAHQLAKLELLPVAISAPSIPLDDQASNNTELTVFQWAYKKLRGKMGVPERVVPEKEIPQDMANIVLAKVAPIFQVQPNDGGSLIRIGGIEISRRSAH